MQKNKTLIVGFGEIGKSLHEVLYENYMCDVIDPAQNIDTATVGSKYDVMHICFPPIPNFIKIVKTYQKKYKPRYTVIHATVPIGTSEKCGAFHSPVRGVHPNIAEGIKTFTKYFAPKNKYLAAYFRKAGVPIKELATARTTEALKIWDTTYYGWNIIFEKLLKEWCDKNKLDFDMIYTEGNNSYNAGYKILNRPEVVRPVLKHKDGEIGGHCVIHNLSLFKSPIAEFILKHNERFTLPKVRKGSSKKQRRS